MLVLSDESQKTKAKMLVFSGVALFVALTQTLPSKVAILGMDLSQNEEVTGWFILAVSLYFFVRFMLLSLVETLQYYLPSLISNRTSKTIGNTIGLTAEECDPPFDESEYEPGTTHGERFEIDRKNERITYRYKSGFVKVANAITWLLELVFPAMISAVSVYCLWSFLISRG